jgi:hypothetical protein
MVPQHPIPSIRRRRRDAGKPAATLSCAASPSPAPGFAAATSLPPLTTGTWIHLNVGGVVYRTTAATLVGDRPSRLRDAVRSNFAGIPVDEHGRPFFDRDGRNFRHIINYLRGYSLVVQPQDVAHVTEDAKFFGLEELVEEIGIETPERWVFLPGPGISPDGSVLSSSTLVAHSGEGPLPPGNHSITFKLDSCEIVGLGVVTGDAAARQDCSFSGRAHSLCYNSTGEIVRNFHDAEGETNKTVQRFNKGDTVTMKVGVAGAEGSTAAWITIERASDMVYQTVIERVVSAAGDGGPIPLRFAVSVRGESVVSIVATSSDDGPMKNMPEMPKREDSPSGGSQDGSSSFPLVVA